MIDYSKVSPDQLRAHHMLVRRGNLRHMLHSKQQMLYDLFHANPESMIYSSRKVGKSYAMVIMGIEHCLRHPKSIVKHVFPTLTLAREVIEELMTQILPLLPDDLQPRGYRGNRPYWKFKNGSQYFINGADPSSLAGLRGPRCDLFLCDEICFWDAGTFYDALFGAIVPQQTTVPIRIVYASTPPEDTNHPSLSAILPKMLKTGALVKFTIYDSPIMTADKIAQLAEMYKDRPNQWRREYLAELAPNEDRRVIPTFQSDKHVAEYFPLTEDPHIHLGEIKYWGGVVVDYGVVDFCAGLAIWYDHLNNKLIIEDMFEGKGMGLRTLKEHVTAKEQQLSKWCAPIENCFDMFEQAALEARREYMMGFRRPTKGKLEDQVGLTRNAFENDRIVVNPRCHRLILQLDNGLWKATEKTKEFERTEQYGHLDLLAALNYAVKHCPWGRTPGYHSIQSLKFGKGRRQ